MACIDGWIDDFFFLQPNSYCKKPCQVQSFSLPYSSYAGSDPPEQSSKPEPSLSYDIPIIQ